MALDLGGLGLGDLLGGSGGGSGGGGGGTLSPSGKGASAAFASVGGDNVTHGLGSNLSTTTLLIAAGIAAALIVMVFALRR